MREEERLAFEKQKDKEHEEQAKEEAELAEKQKLLLQQKQSSGEKSQPSNSAQKTRLDNLNLISQSSSDDSMRDNEGMGLGDEVPSNGHMPMAVQILVNQRMEETGKKRQDPSLEDDPDYLNEFKKNVQSRNPGADRHARNGNEPLNKTLGKDSLRNFRTLLDEDDYDDDGEEFLDAKDHLHGMSKPDDDGEDERDDLDDDDDDDDLRSHGSKSSGSSLQDELGELKDELEDFNEDQEIQSSHHIEPEQEDADTIEADREEESKDAQQPMDEPDQADSSVQADVKEETVSKEPMAEP